LAVKDAVPLVHGAGYGIALLAGYQATWLDAAVPGGDAHLRLHRFEATLAGGGSVAPGWSLAGSFGGAHASDLKQVTWARLQLTTSLTINHELGPSDAVVVGGIYSSTGELSPVLPALGYVHQRRGAPLRIDVLLPHHARVQYAVTPRLR